MSKTIPLPLIPVSLAYAIGISMGSFIPPIFSPGVLFLLVLLALWAILLVLRKMRWAFWVALSFLLFLGLFSIQATLHPELPPNHLSRFIGHEPVVLEGTIDRFPQSTHGGSRLFVRSHKMISEDHHMPLEGRLLLFLKGEEKSFHLGDRLRFFCRLHRPAGFNNPGGFSYERHLALEGVEALGLMTDEKMCVKIGEGSSPPFLLKIEAWRNRIRDFLENRADPPFSSLFQALVLGEQGKLPDDIRELFIVTGIAHLLAISGAHLGVVALLSFSLFFWAMKRSELFLLSFSARKWAAFLTLPILLLYTFIAGGRISMIRAAIMAIAFFLSIVFHRERHLLHALALAAFLILLFSPPALFDVSFQLSFVSVLSILYLVPRILRMKKQEEPLIPSRISWGGKAWQYVKLSFLITAAASLGTAPLVALHFNRVSLIGFLTNLFAVPWVGFLIVPITLTASLFSFFFHPMANFLIAVNQLLAAVLLKGINFFASFPFASIDVSTPTALEIILYYLLLFLGVHLWKGRKIKFLFAGACILLAGDLAYWSMESRFRQDLALTFIDVGHGDSILVEFPGGKTMLIDGGGLHEDRFDIGKHVIAPVLWQKKIRKIDMLVLTHPDPDHLKGLNFIASRFSLGQFWDNGHFGHSDSYLQLEETLRKNRIARFSLNEDVSPLKIHGVEISFLNPPAVSTDPVRQGNPSWLNNQSLVMRLRFNKIILLLTGDVEREAEERMVSKGHSLKAHLLKVPHHGSSTSSCPPFMEKVKPDHAVISVGGRALGRLPHPEVIQRYLRSGAKVFRTDRHGAVTAVTDGEKIKIKTFLKRD